MQLTARPKKIALPENLYCSKGYYRYKHPQTGQYHSVGSSESEAILIAKELNRQLVQPQESIQVRINKILSTHNFQNFGDFLGYFAETILPQRKLSPKTLQDYRIKLPHIHKAFGRYPTNQITVGLVAKFLSKYNPQQSNHYRAFLHQIFRFAIAEGESDNNPAEATIAKSISVQRRSLPEYQFWAIHAHAPEFLKRAMEMGLYTLLRREDLCQLKFEQIVDGFLKVKTHKTGAAIKLKLTPEIGKLIERCKDGVHTEYVLHHCFEKNRAMNKQCRYQILPDFLTKAFSEARDATGLFTVLNPRERPTLHEVRALGAHLYEQVGIPKDVIQALLGHSSSVMTEYYLAKHSERYTEIILK